AAAGLTATLRPPAAGPAAVRWLERRGRKTPNVSLAAVPLDLAPVLKENLFDRAETVVLTSATLAAGGHFGLLEGRVGLDLRTRCATRAGAGGRCSCRAKGSATTCCDASGRRARGFSWEPTRSGRALTCRGVRCGC